jgi:outer membrane protein, multidrug efflux system
MTRLVSLASAAIIAAALIVAGCTVGPNYQPPKTNVPDHFSEMAPPTTQAVRWWQEFKDPQLDSLIDRATRGNLDLQFAEARIRQARAQYRVNFADELPTVSTTGSYFRRRSAGVRTGAGGAVSGSETDAWSAGFDSNWEIDIFGGVRRSVEAAGYDVQAAYENRRNVLVTLTSEVARNYVDYRAFQKQLAVAADNIAAQRESLAVTRRQFEAGLKTATELDVARAQALVASTEAQVPALETGLRQTAHALAILLGLNPEDLTEELGATKPIPDAEIPLVPVGLPSDLLRRRPDIRQAERQLAGATARVGVAVADLFPRFSLTGSLGVSSSQWKSLWNYDSRFWTIGPSVSWPILDWGRIRANIRVQNALEEQAFITYQNTVLIALQEVEDAIVAYSREQVRRVSLAQSVDANKRAVTLANQRYAAGLTDFLSVLDAQRSLYAAQDQLVQSERTVSENLVALYKALGGGWETLESEGK